MSDEMQFVMKVLYASLFGTVEMAAVNPAGTVLRLPGLRSALVGLNIPLRAIGVRAHL